MYILKKTVNNFPVKTIAGVKRKFCTVFVRKRMEQSENIHAFAKGKEIGSCEEGGLR